MGKSIWGDCCLSRSEKAVSCLSLTRVESTKVVLFAQGNNVITRNWEIALCQDLGSASASMEAGKAVGAYGLCEDNCVQQADSEQADIQADLKGNTTLVSLPPEAWPEAWKKKGLRRPVVRLLKALYGHPDSGTFLEKHCDAALIRGNFLPMVGWPSCYWHQRLRLFLAVYVDDFKMSGSKNN